MKNDTRDLCEWANEIKRFEAGLYANNHIIAAIKGRAEIKLLKAKTFMINTIGVLALTVTVLTGVVIFLLVK